MVVLIGIQRSDDGDAEFFIKQRPEFLLLLVVLWVKMLVVVSWVKIFLSSL
jgi:hypothetical protein